MFGFRAQGLTGNFFHAAGVAMPEGFCNNEPIFQIIGLEATAPKASGLHLFARFSEGRLLVHARRGERKARFRLTCRSLQAARGTASV